MISIKKMIGVSTENYDYFFANIDIPKNSDIPTISDGLPKEFYPKLWNSVSDVLMRLYTYSFEVGTLSIKQRRGIIRLIPKKGNDLTFLRNWRPINLQFIEAKLLSLCLAH